MKKNLIFSFLLFWLIATFVFAAGEEVGEGGLEVTWPQNPFGVVLTKSSTLTELVSYFYGWFVSLGGIAALGALIYGGFIYMTSTGNPQKVEKSKEIITSAFFGLGLLLGSWVILNAINPELVSPQNPSLPSIPGGDGGGGGGGGDNQPPPGFFNPCAIAYIYEQENFQGNSISVFNSAGRDQATLSFQPKSIKITDLTDEDCSTAGCLCIVEFYTTNDCSGNSVFAISESTPSLPSLPSLKCVKVKSLNP